MLLRSLKYHPKKIPLNPLLFFLSYLLFSTSLNSPESSNSGSCNQGKASTYSYSQYKNWPDEDRWELIDGEAYNMSPSPSLKHHAVSLEISRQIANYLIGKSCSIFAAPFDAFLPGSNE